MRCHVLRAIVQNAAGHPFWKDFPSRQKAETVKLAKEIHTLLFDPPLKKHIRSAYLPIGGKAYAGTAMQVALQVVEIANKKSVEGSVAEKTVETLSNTRSLLLLIHGGDKGCLGLHPGVFFYNHVTGAHQPAALM
jgi:hypothetical protein